MKQKSSNLNTETRYVTQNTRNDLNLKLSIISAYVTVMEVLIIFPVILQTVINIRNFLSENTKTLRQQNGKTWRLYNYN